jgi:hypothetical protein
MLTFSKTPDPRNEFDIASITVAVSSDVVLQDAVEAVSDFLKACGYSLEGLEVVECADKE